MAGRWISAWRALTGGSSRRSRRLGSLAGRNTAAGVDVTPGSALRIATVFSCVKRVSEDIGGLPGGVFDRVHGERVPVPETDPIAYLLTVQPNPNIDAGELWRTVVAWMMLDGNAYVFIERNEAGAIVALWPLAPSSVTPKRAASGALVYTITPDWSTEWAPVQTGKTYTAEYVLHYRAFGLGDKGLSPIAAAREQIGINYATSTYIGKFFANDATPGTVLSVEGNLTDAQYNRLDEQWRDKHEGFDNAHKLSIVEGGAKLLNTTLSPADAEFLNVYKLTRADIAGGIFSVPLHKIGDLEHATFSNIEEQNIMYVQDACMLWVNRIEKVTRRLFGVRPTRYFKLNVNGLLRGDQKSRYDSYAVARQWGFLSANDIRRLEDMVPITGGDEYLVPLNMLPAGSSTVQRSVRARHVDDIRQIESGLTVRENPAAKAPAWVTRVNSLLADFLAEQRGAVLADIQAARAVRALTDQDQLTWDEALTPALADAFAGIIDEFGGDAARALSGSFNASLVKNWIQAAAARQAHNINETTFDQLRARLAELTDGETPEAAAHDVFDGRVAAAALIAAAVVHSIGTFGTEEGGRQAGGTQKTWRTPSDDPRPSHAALDGVTIPLDERFQNGCMRPGDPAGGADEVAGCTCYLEIS